MKEDEVRQVLAELGREELPDAALAAVRRRVVSEISRRRRPVFGGWMRWAVAAAVAVMVVAAAAWYRQGLSHLTLDLARAGAPKAPALSVPLPDSRGSETGTEPRPSGSRRRLAEPPAEPLVVKMLTPDPDVVIYWLVEPKGD